MKLNKNKIIVSALALAIGTSLAGSIGSTIAWYQYSTRANVSFLGQASGISGNLQMRFKDDGDDAWRTRITYTELETKLVADGYLNDKKVTPMTFGAVSRDSDIGEQGYVQPIFGVSDMTKWAKATKKHYAQFELELRYNERDGIKEGTPEKDEKNVAKDVYLSKLLIQQDYSNQAAEKEDLSEAVRVHIHAYKSDDEANTKINRLISKNGGTTVTNGTLDLDGDGNEDTAYSGTDAGAEFGFGSGTTEGLIRYGGTGSQTSYGAFVDVAENRPYVDEYDHEQSENVYPALVGSDGNELKKLTYSNGIDDVSKKIGSVVAEEDVFLRVRITIWVEGWQKLSDHATPTPHTKAIWNATQYANSKFDIGIQFAVQDAFVQE